MRAFGGQSAQDYAIHLNHSGGRGPPPLVRTVHRPEPSRLAGFQTWPSTLDGHGHRLQTPREPHANDEFVCLGRGGGNGHVKWFMGSYGRDVGVEFGHQVGLFVVDDLDVHMCVSVFLIPFLPVSLIWGVPAGNAIKITALSRAHAKWRSSDCVRIN